MWSLESGEIKCWKVDRCGVGGWEYLSSSDKIRLPPKSCPCPWSPLPTRHLPSTSNTRFLPFYDSLIVWLKNWWRNFKYALNCCSYVWVRHTCNAVCLIPNSKNVVFFHACLDFPPNLHSCWGLIIEPPQRLGYYSVNNIHHRATPLLFVSVLGPSWCLHTPADFLRLLQQYRQ